MDKVHIALANASQTKDLVIGSGVIAQVPEIFRKQFPNKKALIIADTTTWNVAGTSVQALLESARIEQENPFIFEEKDFHAEWQYIERLDRRLSTTEAIPIAVGSGTINDLTKLSSYHCNRRYMTVATAASMDGYTSFGASITKDGAKQTFPCTATQAIVADIDVISTAPAAMTASGYADLFAKIPAGADWIVADALDVEPIDTLSFGIVQDGLHDALSNPKGAKDGDLKALTALTEGLILGGFAMQAYPKSSRPASGADHQFSHLWNMEHHVMKNGQMPSHGFQVSIGTLMSLALYEQLMKCDIDSIDIDKCVSDWPNMETIEKEAIETFKNTDFPMLAVTEMKAKYIDKDDLRKQLQQLVTVWPKLKERLSKQLINPSKAVELLQTAGAPVTPEEIDITKQQLRDSVIRALQIRRRFTILDIAQRCGNLDEWLGNIFGKGGLWEI